MYLEFQYLTGLSMFPQAAPPLLPLHRERAGVRGSQSIETLDLIPLILTFSRWEKGLLKWFCTTFRV